jgi:hypothetical protein
MIAFPPTKKNELLYGTVNSSVHLMNIGRFVTKWWLTVKQSLLLFGSVSWFFILDFGTVTGTLVGHTVPPTHATFSSTGQYCITAAAREALIWNLNSNTLVHRLSLKTDVVAKQVQDALYDCRGG